MGYHRKFGSRCSSPSASHSLFQGRRLAPNGVSVSIMLLLAALAGFSAPGLLPAEEPPPAFSVKLNTVENQALSEQRRKDVRRISLGTASLFHRRLVRTLSEALPENVSFHNRGPLANMTGARVLRTEYEVGPGRVIRNTAEVTSSLSWSVEGSVGIFSFWISTARTNTTAAVCHVEETKLFLNVSSVAENRSVDQKLPELGGRSVRETLRLLESACAAGKKHPPAQAGGKAEDETEAKPADRSTPDFQNLIDLIQEENR